MQIEANQNNAQKSTGPKSADGKAVVSQNAVIHGIFSEKLILISGECEECIDDYITLLQGLNRYFAPCGTMEEIIVEKIAINVWRLRRVLRYEAKKIMLSMNKGTYIPPENTDLTIRYETGLEKSIEKNVTMIARLQAMRNGGLK